MRDFVGVIGGMGPDATVLFLDVIAQHTKASSDQEHLNIDCLQHCTVPDRTAYILDHSQPSPLPDLLEDVAVLNERGASLISMPCNTAHYFYTELQAASTVPVLNMITLAAEQVAVRHPHARRVAVLGTRGTVESGMYHRALADRGFEPVTPPEDVQQVVDNIIFAQVKGGAPLSESDYADVTSTMHEAHDCDVCLVGCTELSVPQQRFTVAVPTVDALVTLADATIERSGHTVR